MKKGKRYSRKSFGFTLIELLVVIAIIALLISVIMPALKAAKRQGQGAVCMSNLKQWGTCYSLYFEDWDSYFPPFVGGTLATTFMESLRGYYDDINKLRTCLSAAKVATDNPTTLQPLSFFGYTLNAWQIDPTAVWLDDEDWGIGSYGESSWIRSGSGSDENKSWIKITNVKSGSDVPVLADARWNNAWPDHTQPVPVHVVSEEDYYGLHNWSYMECFAMKRHKEGLNVLVADRSVKYVTAEMLWNLKWHREYEKRIDVNLDWMDF